MRIRAGLSLALVGAILLLTRVVDALSDPLIGWVSDRFSSRRRLIALALPLLAVGVGGLLAPPPRGRAACGWRACWWW
jgi:GPH family glycoside/pentoside/hexuronide:cation symporter